MIARLWLPLQLAVARVRLPALVTVALAAVVGLGLVGLRPGAWPALTLAALGLIATAAILSTEQRSRRGMYALGPGVSFVWIGLQFLTVGVIPSVPAFGYLALAAVTASVLVLPAVGSAPGVGRGGDAWHIASEAPHAWRSPLTGDLSLAGALLAGAVVVAFWSGSATAGAATAPTASELEVFARVSGFVAVFALWRQQAVATLCFAAGVAAGAAASVSSAWVVAPGAALSWLGVAHAMLWPAAVRLRHDRGGSSLGPIVAASSVALAGVLSGDPRPAVVGAFGVIGVLVGELARRQARAVATGTAGVEDRLAALRRGLDRLTPYERWYGRAKLARDPLYRRAAELPGPWGRVLDIGCGMGLVGGVIATGTGGAAYTGVDLDPDKLGTAADLLSSVLRPGQSAQLEQRAFGAGPDERGGYDTVCLFDVLHYSPPSEQTRLLRAAAERLSGGGRLLVREAVAGAEGAGRVQSGERWTTFFGLNPRGGTFFDDRAAWQARFDAVGVVVDSEEPCGGENVLFQLSLFGNTQR